MTYDTTNRRAVRVLALACTVGIFAGVATPTHATSLSAVAGTEFRDLVGTDDAVWGNAGDDSMFGGGGLDILNGNAGDDDLDGGDRADVLFGGVGNDRLDGGKGADWLIGGSGDDILRGQDGGDTMYGDEGNYMFFDDRFFSSDEMPWVVTMDSDPSSPNYGNVTVEADGQVYGPSEMIIGTPPGSPTTWVRTTGNDTFFGGGGNDKFYGGDGRDTADYSEAASGVVVSLETGQASNDGDGGSDTMEGIENVTGSPYNDTITGDSNANVIKGGAGADVLRGGAGNDSLTGGEGADQFVVEPNGGFDTVFDYELGDVIDISRFGSSATTSEEIGGVTPGGQLFIDGTLIKVNGQAMLKLKNYTKNVTYKR